MGNPLVPFRPRHHDRIAEQLQLLLDLPLQLKPETRRDLENALSCYIPDRWEFVMMGREECLVILKQILAGDRPGVTLAVWEAVRIRSEYGTGVIWASRAELAELAGTTAAEVSRAMAKLTRIGALIRLRPGLYALHPGAAWAGAMRTREAAQAKLALVP